MHEDVEFRRSLRASRARRAAAGRSRRWMLRRRATTALAAAACVAGGGAAVAQQEAGSPSSARTTSSATIEAAQEELGVEADGVMGPKTRRAIRRFQRREELKVTGRLDRRTLQALGVEQRSSSAATGDGPAGDVPAVLARIAECESGGDPAAVSADGQYRGKYQFSRPTWRSVGGAGDPAEAPEPEQDRRAVALYEREGTAPWPVCGKQA